MKRTTQYQSDVLLPSCRPGKLLGVACPRVQQPGPTHSTRPEDHPVTTYCTPNRVQEGCVRSNPRSLMEWRSEQARKGEDTSAEGTK
ncbi:unnamed protein product [Calypogeia fissa]